MLFGYLLTGPVIEAVHSEPVDRTHTCAICAQTTERHATAPVSFDWTPLALLVVGLVLLRAFPLPEIPLLFPDKRGPPGTPA